MAYTMNADRWILASTLCFAANGCSTDAQLNSEQHVQLDVDGLDHAATIFGGGNRASMLFTISPDDDVVVAGQGLREMELQIDISALADTQPDEVHVQQMTVCDPRVWMVLSIGGNVFSADPGNKDIDACTFHFGDTVGTLHGILAFQNMFASGTDVLVDAGYSYLTPNQPEPGVDHDLQFDATFKF